MVGGGGVVTTSEICTQQDTQPSDEEDKIQHTFKPEQEEIRDLKLEVFSFDLTLRRDTLCGTWPKVWEKCRFSSVMVLRRKWIFGFYFLMLLHDCVFFFSMKCQ